MLFPIIITILLLHHHHHHHLSLHIRWLQTCVSLPLLTTDATSFWLIPLMMLVLTVQVQVQVQVLLVLVLVLVFHLSGVWTDAWYRK